MEPGHGPVGGNLEAQGGDPWSSWPHTCPWPGASLAPHRGGSTGAPQSPGDSKPSQACAGPHHHCIPPIRGPPPPAHGGGSQLLGDPAGPGGDPLLAGQTPGSVPFPVRAWLAVTCCGGSGGQVLSRETSAGKEPALDVAGAGSHAQAATFSFTLPTPMERNSERRLFRTALASPNTIAVWGNSNRALAMPA